jgi:hypothetical protein
MRLRSWLTHYATSRKVAGSIPDKVDSFNWPNPSCRTTDLRSTRPLQKWAPRIFLGVKRGRRVGLTTLLSSVSRLSRQNVGASTSHNPMGLHGLLQGYLYLLFRQLSSHRATSSFSEVCSVSLEWMYPIPPLTLFRGTTFNSEWNRASFRNHLGNISKTKCLTYTYFTAI